MSTLDELKKIVTRIAHCGADEIELDTALKDIKADSLHWVQIVIAAEELFNIEIDIEKMKEFLTIRDMVSYIDSLKVVKG
ncbi:MAG TPA: acyl carrier protein [Dehalococcoidia bacterium]|nr:acyl carrier protein [Dehalococcoidia bacterium]